MLIQPLVQRPTFVCCITLRTEPRRVGFTRVVGSSACQPALHPLLADGIKARPAQVFRAHHDVEREP
jgi:hypothetical protein